MIRWAARRGRAQCWVLGTLGLGLLVGVYWQSGVFTGLAITVLWLTQEE